MSENSNRRRFIGGAIAAAASYQRILGANDRIRVGAIGTGGRWGAINEGLQKSGGNEVVAVCDVYEPRRLRAKANAADGATDHVDYREILDRKDVDAVAIATPDHWHVPIVIDAVRAGKDVYCEKPITHTIDEGAPLVAAVRDSRRIVQVGLQQRSWEHYIAVKKEVIDAGVLGQVTFIRTYWYQNHNTAGGRQQGFDTTKLDWKRFLGSATDRPFDADMFANWRWYWDFGGGAMTDLFVHWVDVAHWYMGSDMPTRATATGVKALLQQRQTPDTMSAALSYPAAVVEFDSALLGYIEGGGLMLRGTKGAMRLHRAGYEVYNEIPGYSEAFQTPPAVMRGKSSRDGTIDHVQNFLDCVRSRSEPNAPVEVGVSAARAGHVANLALRGNGVWAA
ncbi:MAG: Gfo/Idh/MocA family protein [Bryobacteraceae bacterium]